MDVILEPCFNALPSLHIHHPMITAVKGVDRKLPYSDIPELEKISE